MLTCAICAATTPDDADPRWWYVVHLEKPKSPLCPRHATVELMALIARGDPLPPTAAFDLSDTVDEERVTAEARLAKLLAFVAAVSPPPTADELEVVEMVIRRMFGKGRQSYGALRIALDKRDFVREGLEELIDGPIYFATQAVALLHALRSS
jgi:hypothetical protein